MWKAMKESDYFKKDLLTTCSAQSLSQCHNIQSRQEYDSVPL